MFKILKNFVIELLIVIYSIVMLTIYGFYFYVEGKNSNMATNAFIAMIIIALIMIVYIPYSQKVENRLNKTKFDKFFLLGYNILNFLPNIGV